ncbi:ABC transporter substrate-binding protein [Marinomonas sp.]|uniref:ABC transporter substrate-binding protein n=1 Tax=Marinomonas sp. TaxID=1904862 RepID=UPI003BA880FF
MPKKGEMLLCVLLLLFTQRGIADELRLGFTGPLTGPNALLGQQAVRGIELGFKRLNASGKLNYRLVLHALDDGYEPSRTVPQVMKLIHDDSIKAIIGSIGTPTNLASLDVLAKYNIPLIAPLSGARSLRQSDSKPFIFNTRADYAEEAKNLIEALTNHYGINPNEVAILAQKDSFGDSGLANTLKELKNAGLEDPSNILQIRYQRNSISADNAVADILSVYPTPKAIIMISTYEISANLVMQLEQLGIRPIYASFSYSGLETLYKKVQKYKANIIVTQTTPSFSDTRSMLINQLLEDMKDFGDFDPPTTVQFESYINTLILGNALLPLKQLPTSQQIEDGLKQLIAENHDYKGPSELQFLNPENRHVWVNIIKDGVIEELSVTNNH